MTVGQKIKKYRTQQGLSQKELAMRSGMSEPAIRNYELGNRYPSKKQRENIAFALEISPLAISDPDLFTEYGVIHALFELEDTKGLTIQRKDGALCLVFEKKPYGVHSLQGALESWYQEYSDLQEGKITQEEYDMWRASYPRIKAERHKKSMDAMRQERKMEAAKAEYKDSTKSLE